METGTIDRLQKIKKSHNVFNRWIAVSFATVIGLASLVIGNMELSQTPELKTIVGMVLILCAFLFFNIPYLAYRLNLLKYAKAMDLRELMGNNWTQYRYRILDR